MAKPSNRTELRGLRNLISEAELILSTPTFPEGRTPRVLELVKPAEGRASKPNRLQSRPFDAAYSRCRSLESLQESNFSTRTSPEVFTILTSPDVNPSKWK